jgi:hypothetical protein
LVCQYESCESGSESPYVLGFALIPKSCWLLWGGVAGIRSCATSGSDKRASTDLM